MIRAAIIATALLASSALAQDAPQQQAQNQVLNRVQMMIGSQAITIADLQSQLEAAHAKIAAQEAELAKLKINMSAPSRK